MSYLDTYINSLHEDISHTLLSNLIENKVVTIEDVLNLTAKKVRELNIDNKEFTELQECIKVKYIDKPEFIVPAIKKKVLLEIDKDSKLAEIELKHIQSLIKPILLNKLLKNDIKTIGQLCSLTKEIFTDLKGVGKTSIQILERLIEEIKNNSSIFTNEYLKNTRIKVVPEVFVESEIIFENFKYFVDSYILESRNGSLIKHRKYFDLMMNYYGVNGSKKLNKTQIITSFKLTNARIDQILIELEKDMSNVLLGNVSRFVKMTINGDLVKVITQLTLRLKEKQVISKNRLHSKFFQGFPTESIKENEGYFTLFWKINDFILSGKHNSHLTLGEYIFLDKSIDKTFFMATAKIIFETLRLKVLPLKKDDLYKIAKSKTPKLDKNTFELILRSLDKIEYFPTGKDNILQIELSSLRSVGDMAERVLFKREKSTSIHSLVEEVISELSKKGINKSVTVEAVRIRFKNKQHIECRGGTGIYAFKEWDENNDTHKDLIKGVISKSGMPLFPKEIINMVKEIRPKCKSKTIRVITSQEFLALQNGKYTLHEWAHKFQGQIKPKVKRDKNAKTRLQQVIEVFDNIESKRILRKELNDILFTKYNLPFSSFRLAIDKKQFFAKDKTSEGTYIVYKEGTDYVGTGTFRHQIGNEIEVFFNNSQTKKVKLRNLVNTVVVKLDVPIDQVYRYINRNKISFHKSIIEKVKYIELV